MSNSARTLYQGLLDRYARASAYNNLGDSAIALVQFYGVIDMGLTSHLRKGEPPDALLKRFFPNGVQNHSPEGRERYLAALAKKKGVALSTADLNELRRQRNRLLHEDPYSTPSPALVDIARLTAEASLKILFDIEVRDELTARMLEASEPKDIELIPVFAMNTVNDTFRVLSDIRKYIDRPARQQISTASLREEWSILASLNGKILIRANNDIDTIVRFRESLSSVPIDRLDYRTINNVNEANDHLFRALSRITSISILNRAKEVWEYPESLGKMLLRIDDNRILLETDEGGPNLFDLSSAWGDVLANVLDPQEVREIQSEFEVADEDLFAPAKMFQPRFGLPRLAEWLLREDVGSVFEWALPL